MTLLTSLISLHESTGMPWEMLLAMTHEQRAELHLAAKKYHQPKK